MNPMGLIAPWFDSLDIIALQPVKKLLWVNRIGLSVPMENYLDIIAFQTAKINW